MVSIKVFKGSKDGLVESSTEKQIGPKQVLLKVTHSGLCGTDVHYKAADMALGHEGVGIVEKVGDQVTQFKNGDRVGWGYQHDSCGHCKQCLSGSETYCPERAMYGDADLDQGSFASHAVWNEDFLFAVPEGLKSEHAAPLMCGGATVFTALNVYGVKSTDRVGIIGVGGLGHLAIQFASKKGCEVVVFSGTESKKDEAMRLGANEFYAMKGRKELQLDRKIDHLLVTTSAQPDWSLYMPLLAPQATIFPISVSDGDLKLPYMALLGNGLTVQGFVVAPRQVHREMLQFAAVHGIKPVIQTFPMSLDGINKAFKTLEDGDMRYRGVVVA